MTPATAEKSSRHLEEYGMLYLLGALQSAHTEFPDTERIVAVTATADALFAVSYTHLTLPTIYSV